MALIRYKCERCGNEQLVFSGEEEKRLAQGNCGHVTRWCHNFIALPPSPVVVHATNSFMSTELMLDTIWTIHDLDRQLNFEVSEEKELKVYNEFRVSI